MTDDRIARVRQRDDDGPTAHLDVKLHRNRGVVHQFALGSSEALLVLQLPIDFDLDLTRQPDPNGDRVKIVMTGKFLKYKKD